jgi:hypothetical protein
MLDQSCLGQLSQLARLFRERFHARLQTVVHEEHFTDRYELVIRAAHPDVGELRVRDDGDELTISLGPHHWHVPSFHEGELVGSMLDDVVEGAVQKIEDVLLHRTILRVSWRNGQIRSTMTYSVNHEGVAPVAEWEKDYVWRGPRIRDL